MINLKIYLLDVNLLMINQTSGILCSRWSKFIEVEKPINCEKNEDTKLIQRDQE